VLGYTAYAVVGAALLAGLVLFYSARGRPAVTSQLRGFTATSERSISITFSVEKSPAAQVRCTVRARGVDGGQVGADEVPVDPRTDGRRETVVTYRLATTGPAVSGELVGCRLIASR